MAGSGFYFHTFCSAKIRRRRVIAHESNTLAAAILYRHLKCSGSYCQEYFSKKSGALAWLNESTGIFCPIRPLACEFGNMLPRQWCSIPNFPLNFLARKMVEDCHWRTGGMASDCSFWLPLVEAAQEKVWNIKMSKWSVRAPLFLLQWTRAREPYCPKRWWSQTCIVWPWFRGPRVLAAYGPSGIGWNWMRVPAKRLEIRTIWKSIIVVVVT